MLLLKVQIHGPGTPEKWKEEQMTKIFKEVILCGVLRVESANSKNHLPSRVINQLMS
jgi:hypothetical protein